MRDTDIHKIAEEVVHIQQEENIMEKLHQIEVESAKVQATKEENSRWKRMVHAVCITTTTSVMGFFVWIGGHIYDKYDAIEAGVKAFITAIRIAK